VGNDIVDLESPRTRGRASDERFVARVFEEAERRTIAASPEPDLELWCHWAAKEAGFKVISKLLGEPPAFVHRAFVVTWSEGADSEATAAHAAPVVRAGEVSWRAHRALVSVALHPGGVHAVAFGAREWTRAPLHVYPRVALLDTPGSPWSGSLEELLPLFSAHEADAVYSRPSAAVRVGARGDLAELIGVPERRLEIVCAPGPTSQRPPRVLLDGAEAAADVSLSHDGRLIAWALWVGSFNQEGKSK
jgi:phosphopantetheinyl transferase (holo-ACP synthase)